MILGVCWPVNVANQFLGLVRDFVSKSRVDSSRRHPSPTSAWPYTSVGFLYLLLVLDVEPMWTWTDGHTHTHSRLPVYWVWNPGSFRCQAND